MYKKYRNKHCMSRITGNNFLRELWPDIKSVTCTGEFAKASLHIMVNAGFLVREFEGD